MKVKLQVEKIFFFVINQSEKGFKMLIIKEFIRIKEKSWNILLSKWVKKEFRKYRRMKCKNFIINDSMVNFIKN